MTLPGAIYRRREGLSVTRVEDDYFIVDPGTRAVFHLNSLGRALWDALAEPSEGDALVIALATAFPDEPQDRIAADVAAFLDSLAAAGLIEIAGWKE